MLFNTEHFGKAISQELSDILTKYTTKDDRANVSAETGVSVSTLRDVTYRTNSVTERNAGAVEKLILIAKTNCEETITESKDTINAIAQILDIK